MKKRTLFSFLVLFTVLCNFSQPVIQDNWDTLYADVTYTYQINNAYYFRQKGNLTTNNKLIMYGDSNNVYTYGTASYIKSFDPSNNSVVTYNFNRTNYDYGLSSAAARTTNTPNVSFVFFGEWNYSENSSDELALYKLNTQNNTVTSETIATTNAFRDGVMNLCFFSPVSNHDSLIIFENEGSGSVGIYKKHYLQNGITNYNYTIPYNIGNISKCIVFNNVLYMGASVFGNGELMYTTNALTYSLNTNYSTQYPGYSIQDMDTLNNELYLSINNGNPGSFKVIKTPNGVTFTDVYLTDAIGYNLGLTTHKKRIWTLKINDVNYPGNYKPVVNYIGGQFNNAEILSADTLGRHLNDGYTFRLNKISNKLYLSGNFIDTYNEDFGTFVYRLREPISNFAFPQTQVCLNTNYTVTSISINADSVRWIKDNNYFAGTQTSYIFNYNTVGSHTIGLIAISGTQRDTLRYSVNCYSVNSSVSAPTMACQNNKIIMNAIITNTVGTSTYSWSVSPTASISAINLQSVSITPSIAANYTVSFNVIDGQGCQSNSVVQFSVNPSKNLYGTATNSAIPVTGNVILYRYESFYTKFDSVTYQPTDALGNYTFNTLDASKYIIQCIPSSNSLMTTYAGNATSWKSASIIDHGCISTTIQNINVLGFVNLGTGPGVLSGKIVEGSKYGQRGMVSPGGPIKGLQVKCGRNPGSDMILQTPTLPDGSYSFSNLPLNNPGESYFVLVDVPGLDTNGTYHKVISNSLLTINNLDFVADSAKITPGLYVDVTELMANANFTNIYPNPTKGLLYLEYNEWNEPQIKEISICNVFGQVVLTRSLMEVNGKLVLDISMFAEGVYFVTLKGEKSSIISKVILSR